MRNLIITSAVTLVALAAAAPAGAEVRSLTLGITLNCPYGLAL